MDTLFNRSSAISVVKNRKTRRVKSIFLLRIFSSVVILLMTIGFQKSYGQGVGISETSIVPHASSILELRHSSGPYKGFLAPRLTTIQRTGITSPAAGLLVYDTETKSFWYWDNDWVSIAASQLGCSVVVPSSTISTGSCIICGRTRLILSKACTCSLI